MYEYDASRICSQIVLWEGFNISYTCVVSIKNWYVCLSDKYKYMKPLSLNGRNKEY